MLPSLLPQLTYIVIAPFIGAEEAIRAIQQLIGRERLNAAGNDHDIQSGR